MPGVVTRTNLVPNPSFETNTTGWAPQNSSITLSRSTGVFFTGSASMYITNVSGFVTGYMYAYTPRGTAGIPVANSTDYTLQFRVQSSMTDVNNITGTDVYFEWYDSDGGRIGRYYSDTTYLSTSWQAGSMTMTAPGDAAYLCIGLARNDDGLSAWQSVVTYYDALILVQGSSNPRGYFDGSTTATGGYSYAWTGTANNSASTETLTANGNMLAMFM